MTWPQTSLCLLELCDRITPLMHSWGNRSIREGVQWRASVAVAALCRWRQWQQQQQRPGGIQQPAKDPQYDVNSGWILWSNSYSHAIFSMLLQKNLGEFGNKLFVCFFCWMKPFEYFFLANYLSWDPGLWFDCNCIKKTEAFTTLMVKLTYNLTQFRHWSHYSIQWKCLGFCFCFCMC